MINCRHINKQSEKKQKNKTMNIVSTFGNKQTNKHSTGLILENYLWKKKFVAHSQTNNGAMYVDIEIGMMMMIWLPSAKKKKLYWHDCRVPPSLTHSLSPLFVSISFHSSTIPYHHHHKHLLWIMAIIQNEETKKIKYTNTLSVVIHFISFRHFKMMMW